MRWLEKNAKNIWSYIRDGQHVIIMENEKKLRKVSSNFFKTTVVYNRVSKCPCDCVGLASTYATGIFYADSILLTTLKTFDETIKGTRNWRTNG